MRLATYCQGTKFEWCSSSVTTTRSPGPSVDEPPRVRDEVDRLRRVPCEDDLARLRRVDERGDLLPRALVALGGALRERVDAPVHVAVRGLVEGPDRIEDLARLLGADRGVEVGERLAVDLLLEDREVAAQLAGIELRLSVDGHVPMVLPGSRRELSGSPARRFPLQCEAVRSLDGSAIAASAAVLLVSAGCGGGDEKSTETGVASSGGAKVFADANCGGCHTLEAAGATGTVGPNLDEVRPNADRVERQVRNGGRNHAGVQGQAERRGDPRGGRVRGDLGREGRGQEVHVRARRQEARRLHRRHAVHPAGVRQPRLRGGAKGRPDEARRDAEDRPRDPGQLPPDRAHDRGGRATPLRRPGRQGVRGGLATPADRATTTASCSGSSPASRRTRPPRSRARRATTPRSSPTTSTTTSASTDWGTG